MNSSQRRQAARDGRAERKTPPSKGRYAEPTPAVRRALEAGLQFHRTGDFQNAAEQYYQALDAQYDQHDALHLLGLISYQSGDPDIAAKLISRSIAAAGEVAVPHISLGDVLQSEGKLEQAVESYYNGLRIEPELAEGHNNCGNALHSLGRYEEAIATYKHAIALKPGYASALNNLGNSLRQLERYDEAISHYRHALVFQPDCAIIHGNMGNALRDGGDPEDAIRSHRCALEIDPRGSQSHYNLGNALSDLGRFDVAAIHYRRSIAIEPRFADAHYNLGNVRCWQGSLEEAVACYHRAASVDPSHVDAYNNLAGVLADLDQLDQAAAAYRIVLEIDPARAEARHMAAALAGVTTEAAPADYVRELFDRHAGVYDSYLLEELDYRAHDVLSGAIARAAGASGAAFGRLLDLGCGTGLAVAALAGRVAESVGVDLSPEMIAEAAAKRLYRDLIEDEMVAWLDRNGATFDMVTAADVLIYTGNLAALFAGVRRHVAPGGLFAFTTEIAESGDYVLASTGRFAHGEGYVRRLARDHRFAVARHETAEIRTENGIPIVGGIFVLEAR